MRGSGRAHAYRDVQHGERQVFGTMADGELDLLAGKTWPRTRGVLTMSPAKEALRLSSHDFARCARIGAACAAATCATLP